MHGMVERGIQDCSEGSRVRRRDTQEVRKCGGGGGGWKMERHGGNGGSGGSERATVASGVNWNGKVYSGCVMYE